MYRIYRGVCRTTFLFAELCPATVMQASNSIARDVQKFGIVQLWHGSRPTKYFVNRSCATITNFASLLRTHLSSVVVVIACVTAAVSTFYKHLHYIGHFTAELLHFTYNGFVIFIF